MQGMTVAERAARVLVGTRYFVLATSSRSGPWAATINHVTVPAPLRLLYYSTRDAAHSVDIARNSAVAGALYLTDVPELGVDGLQFKGQCAEVGSKTLAEWHNYYYTRNFTDEEMRRVFFMPPESFEGRAVHRFYLITINELWIMDTTKWSEDKVDRRVQVPIRDVEKVLSA